jgi:hypothetical protein
VDNWSSHEAKTKRFNMMLEKMAALNLASFVCTKSRSRIYSRTIEKKRIELYTLSRFVQLIFNQCFNFDFLARKFNKLEDIRRMYE